MTRDDPRDFSERGRRFTDYRGQVNYVLYSVLSPLGYKVYVSRERLAYINKHPFAAARKDDIPRILSTPDLIAPNPDLPSVHLYYKAYDHALLLLAVHEKEEVHFLATAYRVLKIKGLPGGRITPADFLYMRGGFRWKRWR